MGIIKARVILQDGMFVDCVRQIECTATNTEAGYIIPDGDCCSATSTYQEVPSVTITSNPTAIYGVFVTDSLGRRLFLDIQFDTEVAATPVTNPILLGKLQKAVNGCACVDCTDVTPVTELAAAYSGTFPSSSTVVAYTITRAGKEAFNASRVMEDYGQFADSTITISSVSGNNVVYALTAKKKPPVVKAGDVIA